MDIETIINEKTNEDIEVVVTMTIYATDPDRAKHYETINRIRSRVSQHFSDMPDVVAEFFPVETQSPNSLKYCLTFKF